MKKNKVIIITLNGYKNFGNRLQNLALTEIYRKKNFNVYTKWNFNFKFILKCYIKKLLFFIPKYKRFNNFYSFSKKYIPETFSYKNCDLVVIGSDQVWNPVDSLHRHELLGIGINEPVVSYAASFGVSSIDLKYYNLYKSGLKNIELISVREDAGIDIINNLNLNKSLSVLIDPTMLLSSNEWNKFLIKPHCYDSNKKYILNYFLGGLNDKYRVMIDELAKKYNCEIINILDKKDPFYSCGPGEFLFLEKNAFIIFTDSFHSSVFALIYNKPFVVFDRNLDGCGNMSSRIDTFLSKFYLNDRKFNDSSLDSYLEYDYSRAYIILKKEQEKALSFIDKSIKFIK